MRIALSLALLACLPACDPAARARADATARAIGTDCLLPAVVPLALDAVTYLVGSLLGNGDGALVGTEAGWINLAREAGRRYGLPAARCAIEHLAGPAVEPGIKTQGDEAVGLPRVAARWLQTHAGEWAAGR